MCIIIVEPDVEETMAKKVIQVPVDERLINSLDDASKKQRMSRSELIRRACVYYLRQMESEEQDRLYQQGFEKMPEASETGEAQSALSGEVLLKESWKNAAR